MEATRNGIRRLLHQPREAQRANLTLIASTAEQSTVKIAQEVFPAPKTAGDGTLCYSDELNLRNDQFASTKRFHFCAR
jgi:hypothetical protein